MAAKAPPDEPSEQIVFQTGLHPASCGGSAVLAGLILLAAALIIRHNDLAGGTAWRVGLGGAALALLSMAGPLLRLLRSRVWLTPRALIVSGNRGGSPLREAPLEAIERVRCHQTRIGRWLGYGTLEVRGDGSRGATLRHVRDAEALDTSIQRALRLARRERRRR